MELCGNNDDMGGDQALSRSSTMAKIRITREFGSHSSDDELPVCSEPWSTIRARMGSKESKTLVVEKKGDVQSLRKGYNPRARSATAVQQERYRQNKARRAARVRENKKRRIRSRKQEQMRSQDVSIAISDVGVEETLSQDLVSDSVGVEETLSQDLVSNSGPGVGVEETLSQD